MTRKRLILALKALVSGFLIWFLLKEIDLQSVGARLSSIDASAILLVLGLFGLQVVIAAARWRIVTVAINAPLRFVEALRIFYIGTFFNQALPGGIGGDAVRMYLASRSGQSVQAAIHGVILERLVAVVGLLLLIDLTHPFFIQRVDIMTGRWITYGAVLASLGFFAGICFVMVLDRIPARFKKWKLVLTLAKLARSTRLIFLNPRNAGLGILWGVLTQVNITFYVFTMAQSLSISVNYVDCLVLIPPVFLVSTLPISIGGWGVREGAMVAALALIGVPNADALILSIVLGILALLASIPAGFVWLFGGDRIVVSLLNETANK